MRKLSTLLYVLGVGVVIGAGDEIASAQFVTCNAAETFYRCDNPDMSIPSCWFGQACTQYNAEESFEDYCGEDAIYSCTAITSCDCCLDPFDCE
jgi:hypothetical protein